MADIKDVDELIRLLSAGWLPEPAPAGPKVSSDADPHVWTVKDFPRLAEKLREQGWIVERIGDELRCKPPRPWSRIQ
jgi:hypothetical protein